MTQHRISVFQAVALRIRSEGRHRYGFDLTLVLSLDWPGNAKS